ncbi:hypothetical protein AOA12_03575 [Microbacterium sp. No. 7]|nr:hypothetical protein AOA12_03575 [Microbacterium sp. No. 7]
MLSCLVSLAVPEAVLRDIGELPDTAPIVVSEPTMLTRGIVAFLAALVDGADAQASSIARHSLEQFMYEMVIALVLDRERARHASRRRDLFDEAQAVVLARSGDVALDVAMIAAECNVSPRTLERAYSARHTTVRGEIRRARVVHAGSMLRDAGYDVLSVDQIAQHVGFSNGSSLARAMRAEGQPSPATIRRDRRGPA